jgi:hypothetical protein
MKKSIFFTAIILLFLGYNTFASISSSPNPDQKLFSTNDDSLHAQIDEILILFDSVPSGNSISRAFLTNEEAHVLRITPEESYSVIRLELVIGGRVFTVAGSQVPSQFITLLKEADAGRKMFATVYIQNHTGTISLREVYWILE